MIRVEDIPECAICPSCGKPFRVVDLAPQAAALGVRVPQDSFVFQCCGDTELTIEDEGAELELRDLLLQFHAQFK